jgi:hypothetical protein
VNIYREWKALRLRKFIKINSNTNSSVVRHILESNCVATCLICRVQAPGMSCACIQEKEEMVRQAKISPNWVDVRDPSASLDELLHF